MFDRHRFFSMAALVAAAILPSLGGPTAAADDDPRDLLRRVLDQGAPKPTEAIIRISSGGGQAREIELRRKRGGGTDHIRIDVVSPYNYKGISYLFLETAGQHDHYSFLPALRRTMRISADALNQPFLATEFYVADMIPPNLDANTYRFAGEEEVAGRKCRLVESVPKSAGNALYGKTILAIDPTDLIVVRTQFFDVDLKPLKVWAAQKVETVDGVLTALDQSMTTADGDEWRLEITKIQYGADLNDIDFSPSGLGS